MILLYSASEDFCRHVHRVSIKGDAELGKKLSDLK